MKNKKKRKIAIVTGSRAEYGLLFNLMKEIKSDSELELQIIATGMHLSPTFGLTYKEIENDGFVISEKVEMLLSGNTAADITKSIGLGIIGFSDAIRRLQPDMAVVLGDRFEILACSIAFLIAKIPLVHIHGGEVTAGAFDEAIRHSITKMAHIHFVAAEPYRKRVIQLGENPDRVFCCGALGVDNIKNLSLLNKSVIEERINFKFGKKNILVTFHPATLDKETPENQFDELLAALDTIKDTKIIFTKPNADTGSWGIIEKIERYCLDNVEKAAFYTSLGRLNYLSVLQYVDMVVGNSSSGIIEVPSFKIPTINIGDRQKGRLMPDTVICCKPGRRDIIESINKGYSSNFRRCLVNSKNPYEQGDASKLIKHTIKNIRIDETLIKKKFYDL